MISVLAEGLFNIAHPNTSALGLKTGDAFAKHAR